MGGDLTFRNGVFCFGLLLSTKLRVANNCQQWTFELRCFAPTSHASHHEFHIYCASAEIFESIDWIRPDDGQGGDS